MFLGLIGEKGSLKSTFLLYDAYFKLELKCINKVYYVCSQEKLRKTKYQLGTLCALENDVLKQIDIKFIEDFRQYLLFVSLLCKYETDYDEIILEDLDAFLDDDIEFKITTILTIASKIPLKAQAKLIISLPTTYNVPWLINVLRYQGFFPAFLTNNDDQLTINQVSLIMVDEVYDLKKNQEIESESTKLLNNLISQKQIAI